MDYAISPIHASVRETEVVETVLLDAQSLGTTFATLCFHNLLLS